MLCILVRRQPKNPFPASRIFPVLSFSLAPSLFLAIIRARTSRSDFIPIARQRAITDDKKIPPS